MRKFIEEIIYALIPRTLKSPEEVNGAAGRMINLQNGVYDLERRELLPHSEKYLFTIQLPVKYDPAAKSALLERFLDTIIPADDPDTRLVLEELAGYCLVKDVRAERAFMLEGTGANGKSTFCRLLIAMLGTDNAAAVDLAQLEKDRFAPAELFGKLVNIHPDLQDIPLETTGKFKGLVSGDFLQAEKKNQQPFRFRSFARMIFSANHMPRTRDNSFAYYRRWIIIPFPNRFEGAACDLSLQDELTKPEALSAFLNLALRGLDRLKQNNYTFTQTKAMLGRMEEYQLRNDSVRYFLQQACIPEDEASDTDKISRTIFFNHYVSFCKRGGMQPLNVRSFNTRLQEVRPSIGESGSIAGKPCRAWKRIGLSLDYQADIMPDQAGW